MILKDWIYIHILPPIVWAAMNLASITIRTQLIGDTKINLLKRQQKKMIYTFWHGRQFLLIRYLSKMNLAVMSSTSRDGRLQAKILKKFHFEIIPGSSSKSPVRALIRSLKSMRQGFNFAITVDGPRGPLYKVKPGALYLAKKTDAYIIPIIFSSSPSIIIKSWDRYLLPIPFSKAVILIGDPLKPSPYLDENTIEKESVQLERILNNLTRKADDLVHLLWMDQYMVLARKMADRVKHSWHGGDFINSDVLLSPPEADWNGIRKKVSNKKNPGHENRNWDSIFNLATSYSPTRSPK